jgi:O-antigen ligase
MWVERLAQVLLLAYPTAMLAVGGGMNAVFLLMLLLALAAYVVRPPGMEGIAWRRGWTGYAVAMCALTAAIFLSEAYHGAFAAHSYDAPARYWLGIPVVLLLQRARPAVFKALQLAWPVAAIVGFALQKDGGAALDHRAVLEHLDAIHYGDFELMLAVLSLASLNWFGRDRAPLKLLKVAGFAAGLAASFASGTRGGWLAIPVFVVLLFQFRMVKPSPRVIAIACGALVLLALAAYSFSPTLRERVQRLPGEISAFGQGNRDTSVGVRMQLYGAAWDVITRHPLFGVGPQGFAREMQPMLEAGKITPMAAELGRGEVHNDILAKTAGMGVSGFLAIAAIYLVPFRLFWRATRAAAPEPRRAGMMGVFFVSGFIVFGLTVEVLDLTMATAFYSFTVAVLLALCYNGHFSQPLHATRGDQHV